MTAPGESSHSDFDYSNTSSNVRFTLKSGRSRGRLVMGSKRPNADVPVVAEYERMRSGRFGEGNPMGRFTIAVYSLVFTLSSLGCADSPQPGDSWPLGGSGLGNQRNNPHVDLDPIISNCLPTPKLGHLTE